MFIRNALLVGTASLLLVLPLSSFGGQTGAASGKDRKDAVLKAEHESRHGGNPR